MQRRNFLASVPCLAFATRLFAGEPSKTENPKNLPEIKFATLPNFTSEYLQPDFSFIIKNTSQDKGYIFPLLKEYNIEISPDDEYDFLGFGVFYTNEWVRSRIDAGLYRGEVGVLVKRYEEHSGFSLFFHPSKNSEVLERPSVQNSFYYFK